MKQKFSLWCKRVSYRIVGPHCFEPLERRYIMEEVLGSTSAPGQDPKEENICLSNPSEATAPVT